MQKKRGRISHKKAQKAQNPFVFFVPFCGYSFFFVSVG